MRSLESIIEANKNPAPEGDMGLRSRNHYARVQNDARYRRESARMILREVIANGRSPVYVREDDIGTLEWQAKFVRERS